MTAIWRRCQWPRPACNAAQTYVHARVSIAGISGLDAGFMEGEERTRKCSPLEKALLHVVQCTGVREGMVRHKIAVEMEEHRVH